MVFPLYNFFLLLSPKMDLWLWLHWRSSQKYRFTMWLEMTNPQTLKLGPEEWPGEFNDIFLSCEIAIYSSLLSYEKKCEHLMQFYYICGMTADKFFSPLFLYPPHKRMVGRTLGYPGTCVLYRVSIYCLPVYYIPFSLGIHTIVFTILSVTVYCTIIYLSIYPAFLHM